MRILLVEDDTDLRERLAQTLVAEGFVVDAVADGREALWLGTEEAFDAAVLDLGLPQLDGVSVLQRWREAGRKLPVLLLTARGRWADKLAGFSAGADDYLTKPFEIDELIVRSGRRDRAGHRPRLRRQAGVRTQRAGWFVGSALVAAAPGAVCGAVRETSLEWKATSRIPGMPNPPIPKEGSLGQELSLGHPLILRWMRHLSDDGVRPHPQSGPASTTEIGP